MIKTILLLFSFCLFNYATAQNIENGMYISYKGVIFPKYAILRVDNDSTQLEVFARWQGVWLPALLKSKTAYQPQVLYRNTDGSLSNENVRIQQKKHLIGKLKNTFMGRMRFKFKPVDTLPEKFIAFKQKGIEYTREK